MHEEENVEARPPAVRLQELLMGGVVASAISAAAELGVADRLAAGPMTAAELAAGTGAHESELYRLLRAIASVGVFAEDPEGRFELTSAGDLLRSDAVGSQRSRAIVAGSSWQRAAWAELSHSLKTGQAAFDRAFGKRLFDYLKEHPDAATAFNDMMTGITTAKREAILNAYDFSGIGTLVDVGGGHGTLVAGMLRAYPHMQGIVFDLPWVVEDARENVEAAGVAERCRLVGGDFFESVPSGGDAYALVTVLHNWDDERAEAILRSCRAAIGDEGRLIVVEWIIPAGNERHLGKFLDLEMLVLFGGRERTEREYAALFGKADFELSEVVVTRSGTNILEASPR